MTSLTPATGNRSRSRHKLLLAATAAAGALALAACSSSSPAPSSSSSSASSSSSSSKVTLTFWTWVPGMSKVVSLWNQSHPSIQVNVNEVTSGNAGSYAKMFSALQAGNAPDLGQVEYATLPNFEHVGGLVDLSQYGAASVKSDFVPWTWGQVSQGSAVYAIPQDIGPMGLFYRSDLFKKYGLAVPTTWAQYLSDAKKLHAANPNAYIAAFTANDAQWFAGLAWQAGAKWFNTSGDTWVSAINDAASTQVANYWQELISQHLVKVEPDFAAEWYNDLSNGTLLTWPTAVWGENTLISNAAATKGDWRVTAMPNWGATKSNGNWGGSTTVVFKDSKHPAQAAQFAEWLNTNQQSLNGLITNGGIYPADSAGQQLPAANSPVAFYGGQNIWSVFRANGQLVNTSFQWGPIMSTTFTQISDGFGKAASGSGTLAQVLTSAQSQTIATMKSQGFSVTSG
ncbi:sugar ABC transporter substrate-binding protein [Trebonia kvetii]|uniref:Sugar ABC transporter substrate-binding protein n=1 Tax=Trebonia kvetii TaxID=2480626 RepID=A0A6P2C5F0_9ACTN|nr:sugar ABC transporter substrate-binding protein [Trebonia kvetii]TVZ06659.1 sugar ABC transporter substrate-binding protein [Trebonia kvetii]